MWPTANLQFTGHKTSSSEVIYYLICLKIRDLQKLSQSLKKNTRYQNHTKWWILLNTILSLPDLCKAFSRAGGLDTGNAEVEWQLPCPISGKQEEAFTKRSQAWWHRAPPGQQPQQLSTGINEVGRCQPDWFWQPEEGLGISAAIVDHHQEFAGCDQAS